MSSDGVSTHDSNPFEFEEGLESLADYEPGGLHPIALHDEISNGRYRIIHKLGYGSFSTVWLARDQQHQTYLAVKVLRADISEDLLSRERVVLHSLKSDAAEDLHSAFVAILEDDFFIIGPNGRHWCQVTEVQGCQFGIVKEEHPVTKRFTLPLPEARCVVAQVVQGLSYIHSHGLVHGDLHAGNILCSLVNFDTLTAEQVYQEFHPPQTLDIEAKYQTTGTPPYLVGPMATSQKSLFSVKISDFSESHLASDIPRNIGTPVYAKPPEAILDRPSGQPGDIWTLACLIYYILGEGKLFESYFGHVDDVIYDMVDALGMLPKRLWDAWQPQDEYRKKAWAPGGTGVQATDAWPLARRIEAMRPLDVVEGMVPAEAAALEELLRGMLKYEPSERITIAEVLGSTFVQRHCLQSRVFEESGAS